MLRRVDPILLALLCGSLAANVYQYRASPSAPPPRPALKAGSTVPPLKGVKLDGSRVSIDYANRPAVLYVFSPSCVWCERNLDNALALSDAVSRKREYDFIAVAINPTGLESYLAKTRLPWTIVRGVSEDVIAAYRMGGTPETIVIGRGGRVENVWSGAFSPDVQRSIEAAFSVRLPGLRSSSPEL